MMNFKILIEVVLMLLLLLMIMLNGIVLVALR